VIRFLVRLTTLLLLLYGIGYVLFAVLLPRPAGSEATDAIVVLTGGSGRVERGFDMLRDGRARRLLVSGVDRRVRDHELAAEHDVAPRLMECCVTLERNSFDTRSNADEVARWVERHRVRSIRLVTNDLHMTRAGYELRKRLGDEVHIVADAVPSDPSMWQIHEEYFKYLLGRAADLIGI
jgi:uncharacterized SAM-binding protein YcdF (DUF218 family)